MTKKFLTVDERKSLEVYMNPEGHNHKDVNWVRKISEDGELITCEVGYWITYLNCRPKYNKEIVTFNKKQQ